MGTKGLALVLCSFQRAGMRRSTVRAPFLFPPPAIRAAALLLTPSSAPSSFPQLLGSKFLAHSPSPRMSWQP